MKETLLEKEILQSSRYGKIAFILIFTAIISAGFASAKSKILVSNHINSIVINKSFENKNYNIELSANSEHTKLLITAGKPHKKNYRFFLFDIDGNLKAETMIRSKETTALVNIEKGNYYYEIFNEDERIENGQLTVK